MRVLLIYPPPWKIPEPGQQPDESGEGPPPGIDSAALLSGDILHLPCGLLSLAAQAQRAGHTVEVLNLFTFAWDRIVGIIKTRQADFFGLSCFTSNRRGTLHACPAHPGAVPAGPYCRRRARMPQPFPATCSNTAAPLTRW